MDKPKVKLTQEAQDMIDMFSELDEAQCNELAEHLSFGYGLDFSNLFRKHMDTWNEAKYKY